MRARFLGIYGFLLALSVGCGGGGAFSCLEDVDCGGGVCEPSGFCSFGDDACPSGQRYGGAAPVGLASRCVPIESSGETGQVPPQATTDTPGGSAESSSSGPSSDEGSTSASSRGSDAESTTSGLGPVCGDGILDDTEACELGQVPETCRSLGHSGGLLGCAEDCTFDTSQCEFCGNGVLDPGEICDGPLDGIGCSDLQFGAAAGASVGCNATCDNVEVEGCGAFVCDADPLFNLGGECPEGCSSCDGVEGSCRIDCNPGDDCAALSLQCPAGRDCAVFCNGPETCTDLQVSADTFYRVEVICSGAASCAGVDLDCTGSYGQCFLNCNEGSPDICAGAAVSCGFDDCGLKCSDAATVVPDGSVDCGTACGCEYCGEVGPF